MNTPGYNVIQVDAMMGSVQFAPLALPRERSYNIEDPSSPLTDPEAWDWGSTSASGQRVTPNKIISVPAAYQAVERISGDIARCPLELWEEKSTDVWEVRREDRLHRLTAIQPNREMDAFTFWQQVMVHRLVYKNAYIFIGTNRAGEPAELVPLLPDRTAPKRANGLLYYVTETNGEKVPLPWNRVMHIRGIGFDNLAAIELRSLMQDAIGLALARQQFAAKLFKRGGRRGGVLEIPLAASKTGADRLEEGFRRKYEDGDQAFTTVILRDGAKFHEAQMSIRDSQVIEGQQESVKDIARLFNIRPGNLGEGENGVYGNKYEDSRDYLDITLRPLMFGICSQARIKLLPVERQAKEQFEHNTDDLLQMSPKEQFEAYGAGVQATLITSNEGRAKLGYPPHKDGDQLRSPHTQSPGGATPAGKGQPPKPKPAADDDQEGDEESALAKLQREHAELVARNVASVVAVTGEQASRAAGSGSKFCKWLDETLPEKCEKLRLAGLAEAAAAAHLEQLTAGLQAIAESNHESTLRAAVETFFKNWEYRDA